MKKYKNRENGFTYVEIIVCMCVAALIVGPLTYSFLNSVKTRVNATHIDAATSYTENLMVGIKEKITNDITQKNQVEKRRIDTSGWEDGSKELVQSGAAEYLKSGSAATTTSSRIAPLSELFVKSNVENVTAENNNSVEAIITMLEERYQTEQYAYEVAIWNMDDLIQSSITDGKEQLTLKDGEFIVNTTTLEKAAKFYTDSDVKYQFNKDFYKDVTHPITFKLTDEMLKTFKDAEYMYIPGYAGEQKVVDVNYIKFTDADNDDAKDSKIQFTQSKIKANNTVCGYHYTLSEDHTKGVVVTEANRQDYTSIIDVDVSALLRNDKGTNLSDYEGYTLKFTNTTDFDQIIRIGHSLKDGMDPEAQKIYDSINVIVQDQSTGKSTVSRKDKEDFENTYLIAIIVRDKNPVQGEEGKIVKKMIDIYSYDVNMS